MSAFTLPTRGLRRGTLVLFSDSDANDDENNQHHEDAVVVETSKPVNTNTLPVRALRRRRLNVPSTFAGL